MTHTPLPTPVDVWLDALCDHTVDMLTNLDDVYMGHPSPDDVYAVMMVWRTLDPTESTHAAHVRDHLRDLGYDVPDTGTLHDSDD